LVRNIIKGIIIMLSVALESFFSTLGTMVANKKLLASWLVLLSVTAGMTGDKVFRTDPKDAITISNKLDSIQEALTDLKKITSETNAKIDEIRIEQAKVRTELDIRNEHGKK
jgi:hypothetical protein